MPVCLTGYTKANLGNMEGKFDIENFEKFLREVTDEFKLYPSQRVWHSIYNNIHPGKKWPSVTMTIFLGFTLVILGYINSPEPPLHTDASPAKAASAKATLANTHIISISNTDDNNPSPENYAFAKLTPGLKDNSVSHFVIAQENIHYITTQKNISRAKERNAITVADILNPDSHLQNSEFSDTVSDNYDDSVTATGTNDIITASFKNDKHIEKNLGFIASSGILADKEDNTENKFSWLVYATPSVVFSKLSNNQFNDIIPPASGISNLTDINAVYQKPSIGVEVGATMQYSLLKSMKLTTGLQLNYTKYNVGGIKNFHSTASALTINDNTPEISYLIDQSSAYPTTSGITNPVNYSNQTYQLSLPLGVELKVMGSERLKFNVGATIQPTLVMGGNAYLISADQHNLVQGSSSISNWNLNAGFETFISYNMSGLTWQLGPQIRYQLLSTYNRNYSIIENLSTYGLKIGISRQIK